MAKQAGLFAERFGFLCLLILLWALAARQLGSTVVAAPWEVLVQLRELLTSSLLWSDIALSMKQAVLALALATVFGVGVGILGWRFTLFRNAIFPWLAVLNTVPSVLLYPVAIVMFGLGTAATVTLSMFLGAMVMAESTYAGLRSVDRVYLEVASIFQASRLDIFRKVLLPGAMSIIATGLRVGFTLVFVVVIATGYILSGGGLGYRLRFYYESFAMSKLYALVVVIIGLSLACQFAILGVLRLVLRSSRQTARENVPVARLERRPLVRQL